MNLKIKNNGVFEELVVRGLKGIDGKTAYDLAVDEGFQGSQKEWISSLEGTSAYELAVQLGFEGSEEEWIESLHGHSVPAGGTAGQLLKKNSDTDFDYSWFTLVSTTSINVPVSITDWVADSAYEGYSYKAILAANGVTSTNNIAVGLSTSSTSAQEEACGLASIQCKEQSENQIVLYAKAIPTMDLTISVIIFG